MSENTCKLLRAIALTKELIEGLDGFANVQDGLDEASEELRNRDM